MFSGCTNLSSITCLAKENIEGNCTFWVNNVASTGTFTLAAGARWEAGTDGIPDGWTVVNYDANN